MSISDLYSTGKHKQEIGHFASVVKIAKTNNIISEGEQILLDRTARRLNIDETEYANVLKNPEKYPVNPPISYDERIERLYRLTKMVFADGNIDKDQVSLMQRTAVALQFPTNNVEKVCNEAINSVKNEYNIDDFTAAIKKINAI